MISKDLEATILRLYAQEKWTVRAIRRHLDVHQDTVERVLRRAGLREVPRAPVRSCLDPWLPLIEETLSKYPSLCASRLYLMAVERGHRGSPDHFRHYVAHHRPRKCPEAFARLRTLPGEQGSIFLSRPPLYRSMYSRAAGLPGAFRYGQGRQGRAAAGGFRAGAVVQP